MKRIKPLSFFILIVLLCLGVSTAYAQDFGFGFGDETDGTDEEADSGMDAGSTFSPMNMVSGATVSGALEYDTSVFYLQENDTESLLGTTTGKLEFSAGGSSVDTALKLKINKHILTQNPENLVDEASIHLFMGKLDLEGGLLKVFWGKADSQGPLDILNPLDLTDLTITDAKDRKIAQPMLRASYALGSFTKLELVFLPGFQANRIAYEGIWTPAQIGDLKEQGYNMLYYGTDPTAYGGKGNGLYNSYYMSAWSTAYTAAFSQFLAATPGQVDAANAFAINTADTALSTQQNALAAQADGAVQERLTNILDYPETSSMKYAQGGARFTTTVGSVDLGLQYFAGFLPNPVVSMDPTQLAANEYRVEIAYNPYFQIGADVATVLGGFNLRSEVAANISDDLDGDAPDTYNPAILWSLGFDRDLFSNVTLNIQGNGSYRLFNDEVGSKLFDIEDGRDLTSTKITAMLSQKLFKDTVEWEVAGVYSIEDQDFLIMPSLSYSVGDGKIEASAGIFGGDSDGELGQFKDNSYGRIALSYTF